MRAPLHLTSPHASACWRGGWQAANGRLQLGWAGLGNVPTPRGPPGRPLEGDDGWPTGGLLVPSGCIDGARDASRWCGLWAVDTSSEIALMTNSWGHLKRGWEAQAGPVWRWLALTGWAGCRVMSGYKLSPRWLGAFRGPHPVQGSQGRKHARPGSPRLLPGVLHAGNCPVGPSGRWQTPGARFAREPPRGGW